ncbi:MAG: hypothetical protein AAF587_00840 [Bacteroidota bacterium]
MNTTWTLSLLRAYRIFRLLVLVTVIVGGFLIIDEIHSQYIPLFILMILPTITPFMTDLILERQKPEFFYYFSASIFLFTGIYTIQMTQIGSIALAIWLVEMLISLAFSLRHKKEEEIVMSLAAKVDLNWHPPTPPALSPKEVIRQRIREADREIQHYARKLQPLQTLYTKSQTYLQDVDKRLNYPHLSHSNRQTSLKLQEVLSTSLENYQLMIRFFEEARLRYQRDKRNLQERLGNMEIIAFLNDTDRMEEIAAIEKAALDIEFQQQLRSLENELPEIDVEMETKTDLLSHSLKEDLVETIERLKGG